MHGKGALRFGRDRSDREAELNAEADVFARCLQNRDSEFGLVDVAPDRAVHLFK